MSDTTAPVTEVKKPRFAGARARVRRVLRHPVTLVTAAAVGGGTAAYVGTDKALRKSIKESAETAVEQLTDIIETHVEES